MVRQALDEVVGTTDHAIYCQRNAFAIATIRCPLIACMYPKFMVSPIAIELKISLGPVPKCPGARLPCNAKQTEKQYFTHPTDHDLLTDHLDPDLPL